MSKSRPTAIVVSDADCGAVGTGRKSSRAVGGKPLTTPGVPPQNWGENEPNHTVTCLVLKATANDRRHLALCHDKFRGPRSGGISNNDNNMSKMLK
ncbi:hypothetical protein TNCV_3351781 [Trichonephila clavipes]|nr:hypothetical protein TNCV_3351781 [Trichonephila clavipes]